MYENIGCTNVSIPKDHNDLLDYEHPKQMF